MRTVLSLALTRATREELVMLNVALLAELPGWERQNITPWTAAEAGALQRTCPCRARSDGDQR